MIMITIKKLFFSGSLEPWLIHCLDSLFRFQSELTAGGVDIQSFFPAQGGGDFAAFEDVQEGLLDRFGGAFPRQTGYGIVGDEVHPGMEATGQVGQAPRVVKVVIDASNQDIFERDHPALFSDVIIARVKQVAQGVLAVDGHEARPHRIGDAMERHGKAELPGFVGELTDLRGQSAGRDGDFARTDAPSPRSIEET
jgi:hypothetical protein